MAWTILLDYTKITCNIDIPFKGGKTPNVRMSFKAYDFDACKVAVTRMAENEENDQFFFWSPWNNLPHEKHLSNCYVFRTCSEGERSFIKILGTTYQSRGGKLMLFM